MHTDVTRAEFDALVERVRVWGRPDRPDAEPLVRRITPEVTRAALATVREGRTVSLGRPWATHADTDNQRPALHYMTRLGELLAPGDVEPSGYMDFIGADYHGKTVSHIDAFNHIAYEGLIFGGAVARDELSRDGIASGDVTLYGPLVTRGILLDMAALTGVDWVEPGTVWRQADVEDALERVGVELRSGDALLLHSGHDLRRERLGAWDPDASAAGLHVDCVPWLFEQGVAILGADDETDVRPSPVEGVTLPIHVLALVMAGVPLLDNLALDALARACAETGRAEFALSVAPLSIPGGTGSPVNPTAIF